MRAIQVATPGGPEVLRLVDIPTPTVAEDEVLVRNMCAGVNYIDTYHREGRYPLDLPFIPGQEGAGVIEEVGAAAAGWSVGDRVAWAMIPASYAEYVSVPARLLARIPDGVSEDIAAAVMLQGLTAHYLVTSVYPADDTTTAVVHAAAGGVGLLLTQMLKARGATVIGTVSSEEKVARALGAGADHVIRYDQEPWEEKTRELVGDKRVDVVYDGVGQSTFEAGLTVLRPRGLMALYGAASGAVPPFDLQRLNGLGSLAITRPNLGDFVRTPEELAWRVGEIFDAVQAGTLTVAIAKTFSLDDAAEAHRAIQSRQYSGKILLSLTP